VQSQQTALAVAIDTDWNRNFLVPLPRPVNGRKNLLYFVSDDVTSHLIRHAVNKFSVRLVGPAIHPIAAGPRVLAVDQPRHENTTATFSQGTRELCFCWNARR